MVFKSRSQKYMRYLLPAIEVSEGYVFKPVCQSFCSWGGCLPKRGVSVELGVSAQGGVCPGGVPPRDDH